MSGDNQIGLMNLRDNLIVLHNGERYTTEDYIDKLQQENQQLKNDNAVMKAGLIQISNEQLKLYKDVIEEVREYIKGFDIERLHEVCEHNLAEVLEYLLQILDKVKEVK